MALQLYKIATITVGSGGSASLAFTSIPQGYTDLKIVANLRAVNDIDYGTIKFNATTTTYASRRIIGDGVNAYGGNRSDNLIFGLNPSSTTANTFSSWELYLPNYTGSTYKPYFMEHTTENNATSAVATMNVALWSNTSAVTEIILAPNTGNFAENTTATLYGIL